MKKHNENTIDISGNYNDKFVLIPYGSLNSYMKNLFEHQKLLTLHASYLHFHHSFSNSEQLCKQRMKTFGGM